MNYDAVAVGDDDLIYGGSWLVENAGTAGLPLVASNCSLPGKKPLAPVFRVINKKGIRFGIVSLAPVERLFARDDSCRIAQPVAALRSIWKKVQQESDYRIILSHLGEEMTRQLADSFPECAVIVNGHRKTSLSPVDTLGNTLLMEFGFEGKKLSMAKVFFDKKSKQHREVQNKSVGGPPVREWNDRLLKRKGTERPICREDVYRLHCLPYLRGKGRGWVLPGYADRFGRPSVRKQRTRVMCSRGTVLSP
jgi:2',3'-cyclic-nucleotide 2'-phosphodiesterase (5'-nucleotidase family)